LNTPIKGAASFTSEATSHGSKQKVGKVATCQSRVFATPSECSMAELPLFLSEPQSSSAVKDDEEDSSGQIKRWRQMLEHPRTNLIVTCLICLNTAFLACDMQVKGLNRAHQHNYLKETAPQSSSISDFFKVAEQTFTLIFLVELIIRIAVLQRDFFRIFNFIDVVAVTVSIVFWAFPAEIIFNPMMIRLVRLIKLGKSMNIVKGVGMVDTLRLLLKCMSASLYTLACSLSLLFVIQCVAGMLISQLVSKYTDDVSNDFKIRLEIFRFYGTFTRSMLTMFEVTLANWSPPCRILVDNVSEWYSALFIVYRCLIGFACLNVINAVFIQQTMRVAQQDKEIMIMQRERAQADNSRKMQEIFHTLDESGDGMISWDEFSKLLTDPSLKMWMSAMDLDIADIKGLWNLLDDGKGHIVVDDFIQGAARVKGPAKGFDMAQVLLNSKRIEEKINLISTEVSASPLCNWPMSFPNPLPQNLSIKAEAKPLTDMLPQKFEAEVTVENEPSAETPIGIFSDPFCSI